MYEQRTTNTELRTIKHIFAGSQRIATVSLRGETDEAISYYHSDHLGSSSVITDKDGNEIQHIEYLPFGKTAVSAGTDTVTHKYTGKELDAATGLYYYGARYYDAELGRFITADTIIQSSFDPQTFNRYTYCRNNPIKYIDPSGHFFGLLIAIIVAVVKAAAVGAIIGGAMAAITGGDIGKGMLTGAISGVIFAGVGALGLSGLPQFLAHTAAGAVSGTANAAIMGGDIGRGALIGGASAGAANLMGNYVPFLQDVAGDGPGAYFANVTRRASIGAIVGGSVSAATGGRFGRGAAQGAMTSAIAYTANDWMHKATEKLGFVRKGRELAKQAKIDAKNSKLDAPRSGPYDAYRHARWNELMREEIGPFKAFIVSMGHEIFDNQVSGDQSFDDFRMDTHNNFQGAFSGKDAMILYGEGKLKVLKTSESEYDSGY